MLFLEESRVKFLHNNEADSKEEDSVLSDKLVINITAERRSVKAEPWLPSAVVFDLPSSEVHQCLLDVML